MMVKCKIITVHIFVNFIRKRYTRINHSAITRLNTSQHTLQWNKRQNYYHHHCYNEFVVFKKKTSMDRILKKRKVVFNEKDQSRTYSIITCYLSNCQQFYIVMIVFTLFWGFSFWYRLYRYFKIKWFYGTKICLFSVADPAIFICGGPLTA